MVEQRFKNVLLDVRKKKSLEEARGRERRMEEEQRRGLEHSKNKSGGGLDLNGLDGGGGGVGGGDLSEEGRRWQMQIQEDVSIYIIHYCCLYNSFQFLYIDQHPIHSNNNIKHLSIYNQNQTHTHTHTL